MSEIYTFSSSGMGFPFQKKSPYDIFMDQQCLCLKRRYPFLTANQIKQKAKSEWKKLAGNEKEPKKKKAVKNKKNESATNNNKKKMAHRPSPKYEPLDVNLDKDNHSGILKRKGRGSDITKHVSFNKKNEIKLRTPSIDGSSPVPGNSLQTKTNKCQGLKNNHRTQSLLQVQQDKVTTNATWSYKTQRCIEIQSVDTNKNSKNIKAVICEERSVTGNGNFMEESFSDDHISPTPQAKKKRKVVRKPNKKNIRKPNSSKAMDIDSLTEKDLPLQNGIENKNNELEEILGPKPSRMKTRKKKYQSKLPSKALMRQSLNLPLDKDSSSDESCPFLLTRRSIQEPQDSAKWNSDSEDSCRSIMGSPEQFHSDEENYLVNLAEAKLGESDKDTNSSFDSLLESNSNSTSGQKRQNIMANLENRKFSYAGIDLSSNEKFAQQERFTRSQWKKATQLQKTKCLGSVDPVTTHNVPTTQKNSNLGAQKQDVKVAKSKVKSGTRSKTPKLNVDINSSSVVNSELSDTAQSDSLYEPSDNIFESVSSSPNVSISRYNLRNQSQILNKNATNIDQYNSQRRVLLLSDCSSVGSSPIREKMASQPPNRRKPRFNVEKNKKEETTSSLAYLEQFVTTYDSTSQKHKGKKKDSKVSLNVRSSDLGSQESQLVALWDSPSLKEIVELERPYIKASRSTDPEERRDATKPCSTVAPFNFGQTSFVDKIVSQIRRCSAPQLYDVSEQDTPMSIENSVHRHTTSFNCKTPMSRYAMPHSQTTQSNNLQKTIVKMQSKEDKHSRERYMTTSTVISNMTESSSATGSVASSMYTFSSLKQNTSSMRQLESETDRNTSQGQKVNYFANMIEDLVSNRVRSERPLPRETHMPVCEDGKKTQSNTMSLVDEKWDKLLSSPSLEKLTTVPKSNITSILKSLQIERFEIPDTRESIRTAIDDESELERYDASSVDSSKNSRDFSLSSVQDANVKSKSIVSKRSRANVKINEKKNDRSTSIVDVGDTILTKTPKPNGKHLDTARQTELESENSYCSKTSLTTLCDSTNHSNWNIYHNEAGENSSSDFVNTKQKIVSDITGTTKKTDDINTYRDKIPLAHGKLDAVEQRRERSLSPYSEIRRASMDNIKCRILSQREEDLFHLSSSDDEIQDSVGKLHEKAKKKLGGRKRVENVMCDLFDSP